MNDDAFRNQFNTDFAVYKTAKVLNFLYCDNT